MHTSILCSFVMLQLCTICIHKLSVNLYPLRVIQTPLTEIRIHTSCEGLNVLLFSNKIQKREMLYLTTHSTHFIYGYMASYIWLRTILIVRKETRCRHIGYSYRLTARVLLYAPSHREDNTYHGLCYTSRGALAGTRNSSMIHTSRAGLNVLLFTNKTHAHYIYIYIYMCVCVCVCMCVCVKEIFYLTTHSTHFIYGYSVCVSKDMLLWSSQGLYLV